MAKIDARILRGFRDYLPERMLARNEMLRAVEQVFLRFGFAPQDTPALEYSECLLGKYGDEGDKLLYRFRDNGDRDVALRYDLTVPLARVMAMNQGIPLPYKRYQIGPVWRAEKPGRGRYREFVQCDADIVGAPGVAAEAETLAVGEAILLALGVDDFVIRVNHRGVFDGLLDAVGVEDAQERAAVVRTLDKIEKIGKEKVLKILEEDSGLDRKQREVVTGYLDIPAGDLEAAKQFFSDQERAMEALDSLSETLDLLQSFGAHEHVQVDFSIARGLDYYTGLIYETQLNELPDMGSVMSGGRYDGLTSMFGVPPQPAIGISLGVDRLFAALIELDRVSLRASPSDILLSVFAKENRADVFRLAQELRRSGTCVEVYLGRPGKLKKQFKYADRKSIPLIGIQGPDEAEKGQIKIKRLSDGEERVAEIDKIKATIDLLLDQ